MLNVFFRRAWENSDEGVPKIGSGSNVVPTIHVSDLGAIVSKLLFSDERFSKPYLMACDRASATTSLSEVLDAVATALTSEAVGTTCTISVSDAYFIDELAQLDIDTITANFRMESSFAEDFITWKASDGILSNIRLGTSRQSCVAEFINACGLEPIRFCIQGPPSSGKSELCKHLSQTYGIRHVDNASAIEFAFEALKSRHKARRDEIAATTDVAEADQAEFELSKKHLVELTNNLENMTRTIENMKMGVESKLEFSPSEIQSFFKEILASKTCTNQGYVLDGFPETGWRLQKKNQTQMLCLALLFKMMARKERNKV